MKKILSKREKDNIIRRNIILISILGIFLIGLMVFSTFGFAMSGRGNEGSLSKLKINGIEFVKNLEFWIFDYQGQNFQMRYSPEEVENFSIVTTKRLADYNGKPLYFIDDSGEPLYEFLRNMEPYYIRATPACMESEDCIGDYPVKNCESDNIIIINEPGNNTYEGFYEDNNCIFINADYANQTRYVDAYMYKLMGL